MRYGLISTYMWTWAVRSDGANNLYVSPAFRNSAMEPTLLEATFTNFCMPRVTCQAQLLFCSKHEQQGKSHVTRLAPKHWTSLGPLFFCGAGGGLHNPPGSQHRWHLHPMGTPAASSPHLLQSGGPANRTRSHTASQQTSPNNRAQASSDSCLDVVLLPGGTSAERKTAMKLARAAAAFERDWVMGFLGAGALGEVLWGR